MPPPVTKVALKKLPEAIEESIFLHEKFPFIIDPTEQAARFLKYQMGSFILADDVVNMTAEKLNRSLVGALQHGRTMTIKFATVDKLNEEVFKPNLFPIEVLDRASIYKPEVWSKLIQKDLGDPELDEFTPSQDFVFIICCNEARVPPHAASLMHIIHVEDNANGKDQSSQQQSENDSIAELYGAAEIVRNSPHMVEAGFDGDLPEIQSWIEKGYHIESMDGRKHTTLSEASCQGHSHVVAFLLEQGANPNALSDTDRSPLWRASFNQHIGVVRQLLEAGSDPDIRDKISGECAFDVSQTDELRELLGSWDRNRTMQLMEARARAIAIKLEERIKTSAEREQFAKMQLNKELVSKAEAGDVQGIKEILSMVAEEAEKTSTRPRITAECRNTTGQSLLSIAAQRDDLELAKFLITHWKDCDKDRWDLAEGDLSIEAKTFKTSPNTRDMKGWSCVCIAVFHNSLKVLQLLLENGGDPNIRSSYNKNAWDLAKDEVDAAEHVIKSRADVRKVLQDYDTTSKGKAQIFGTGVVPTGPSDLYRDLGNEGSALVMNIEMNKSIGEDMAGNNSKTKKDGGGAGSTKNKKVPSKSGGKKK